MMPGRGRRRHRRARGRLAPDRGHPGGRACRDPGRYDLVPRDRADGVRRGGRARPADCGPTRRSGSRAASRGSDSTPTTAPSPTRSAGSAPAVAPDKGCYRGQETVARVHTLGRPPRRLTLLHLDGSENRLPAQGTPLIHDGRQVGRLVGTSARHHELGPIALGPGQAQRAAGRDAGRRRAAGGAGGRGGPRGRTARPPRAALSHGDLLTNRA